MMVGTALLTTMTQNNQRSLGATNTMRRRLTMNSFITKVLTTTRLSVARNAFTRRVLRKTTLKCTLQNRITRLLPLPQKKTMWNRRLYNIVTQDSSSSSRTNRQGQPRKFLPERVIYDWKRLFYRAQVLLRYMRMTLGLKAMIGDEAFERLLKNDDLQRMATQEAERQERRTVRSAQIKGVRFIFGEVLPLYQGTPDATADPLTCEHPTTNCG